MEIHCENIGKRFKSETLFKQFNKTFSSPRSYAILGPNASGKSTLIRIIAGVMDASVGSVQWSHQGKTIEREQLHQYSSFTAPAMDLFEDYTVLEMLEFHFGLKEAKFPIDDIIQLTGIEDLKHKKFSELSSGLRNKIKLSLAIFTKSEILILDEPCTNFDQANVSWYQDCISKYCKDQLLIVASNQIEEYSFCEERIQLTTFK